MDAWELPSLIAASGAAAAVIWKFGIYPAHKLIVQAREVLDDWQGHPRDPSRGIDRRAGVMERLSGIENEVRYNGGARTMVQALKDLELSSDKQNGGIAYLTERIGELQISNSEIMDRARHLTSRADENRGNILRNKNELDDLREKLAEHLWVVSRMSEQINEQVASQEQPTKEGESSDEKESK